MKIIKRDNALGYKVVLTNNIIRIRHHTGVILTLTDNADGTISVNSGLDNVLIKSSMGNEFKLVLKRVD